MAVPEAEGMDKSPTPGELQDDKEFGVSAHTRRDWQHGESMGHLEDDISNPVPTAVGDGTKDINSWHPADCTQNGPAALLSRLFP